MKSQHFKKYNFSREIHGKLDFLKKYVARFQHRYQKYQDEARDEAEALAAAVSARVVREIEPYTDGLYIMTPFRRVELVARIMGEIR